MAYRLSCTGGDPDGWRVEDDELEDEVRATLADWFSDMGGDIADSPDVVPDVAASLARGYARRALPELRADGYSEVVFRRPGPYGRESLIVFRLHEED